MNLVFHTPLLSSLPLSFFPLSLTQGTHTQTERKRKKRGKKHLRCIHNQNEKLDIFVSRMADKTNVQTYIVSSDGSSLPFPICIQLLNS